MVKEIVAEDPISAKLDMCLTDGIVKTGTKYLLLIY